MSTRSNFCADVFRPRQALDLEGVSRLSVQGVGMRPAVSDRELGHEKLELFLDPVLEHLRRDLNGAICTRCPRTEPFLERLLELVGVEL
jgi:hypothetical protein